ncbi:iron-containing alcohol dehydrogenase [Paracraurococcus lichenis]|uniref:Iron-containing alcohol dehydrogenase n=1 Tax=Paracraurococcus lichenis TaxID=3064888 RepID=A0ABT9DSR1_9PROT|nr:iron-containing alcohol dehydrogenase [Paracraurococcus sp. LOR1-02]MDO9706932.1 iron-containing alcohol dehydrogenase [Paracraurococcus sp. LOR1-02]
MSTSIHRWPAQQRVRTGPLAETLPPEIADCTRVLLATTRSLAKSEIAAAVRAAIGAKLAGEHATMRAHSPFEDVLALAQMLRETRAERVVALGGGSVIDGAKVACRAVWAGATDRAALAGLAVSRGAEPEDWDAQEPSPRIVAVPTTLSAAEFAPHAGYTDLEAGRKMRAVEPSQVPRAVILDPAATLETPAELLLSSGIRAVDHAAERLCATRRAPFSDAVSRQALLMLAEALPAIHRAPRDLPARAAAQQAMWLSVMGGWSGVPVGASHGIGYILGGARGVPHGITSCLGLPAVMQWNEPVNGEAQAEVARLLGGTRGHEALRGFIRGLGLPTTLAEVGIAKDEIEGLAARWDGGPPIATNPRKVEGPADVAAILRLMR